MWTLLDSDEGGGARLELYARDGVHMIRADGWELMNGAYHASEDALGRLAARLVRSPAPAILVGGLGLGHTLASLIAALEASGRLAASSITVAERSAAVLRWFRDEINPRLASALPENVRLVAADVADVLGAGRGWDAIVLDVDNGPAALSAPENAGLYDAAGLARCGKCLAPGGYLLLWSAFSDVAFERRAREAGFSVEPVAVPYPARPDQAHLIYVLCR